MPKNQNIIKILKNPKLVNLQQFQTKEMLKLLYEITDNIDLIVISWFVVYEPELKQSILDKYKQKIKFILTNYTFNSIKFQENHFSFEAGFGAENIGHIVKVPYKAVIQITNNNYIVYINSTSVFLEKTTKISSKEIFRQNITNNKFFKEQEL